MLNEKGKKTSTGTWESMSQSPNFCSWWHSMITLRCGPVRVLLTFKNWIQSTAKWSFCRTEDWTWEISKIFRDKTSSLSIFLWITRMVDEQTFCLATWSLSKFFLVHYRRIKLGKWPWHAEWLSKLMEGSRTFGSACQRKPNEWDGQKH